MSQIQLFGKVFTRCLIFSLIFSLNTAKSQLYNYKKYDLSNGLINNSCLWFTQDTLGFVYGYGRDCYHVFNQNKVIYGTYFKFGELLKCNAFQNNKRVLGHSSGIIMYQEKFKIHEDTSFIKDFEMVSKMFVCDSTSSFQKIVCDTIIESDYANLFVDKKDMYLIKKTKILFKSDNVFKEIALPISNATNSTNENFVIQIVSTDLPELYVVFNDSKSKKIIYKVESGRCTKFLECDSYPLSFKKTKQGVIYVLSSDYLYKYDGNKKSIYPIPKGYVPSNLDLGFSELIIGSDNKVYFANKIRLFILNEDKIQFIERANLLDNWSPSKILKLKNGDIIVDYQVFRNGKLQSIIDEKFYQENSSKALLHIFEDSENNLWYAVSGNVYCFTPSNITYDKVSNHYFNNKSLINFFDYSFNRRVCFLKDTIVLFQNDLRRKVIPLQKYFRCIKPIDFENMANSKVHYRLNNKGDFFVISELKSEKGCINQFVVKFDINNNYVMYNLNHTIDSLSKILESNNVNIREINITYNIVFDDKEQLCILFDKYLLIFEQNRVKVIDNSKLGSNYSNPESFYDYTAYGPSIVKGCRYLILDRYLCSVVNDQIIRHFKLPDNCVLNYDEKCRSFYGFMRDSKLNYVQMFYSRNNESFFIDLGKYKSIFNKSKKDIEIVLMIDSHVFIKHDTVYYKVDVLNKNLTINQCNNALSRYLNSRYKKSNYYTYYGPLTSFYNDSLLCIVKDNLGDFFSISEFISGELSNSIKYTFSDDIAAPDFLQIIDNAIVFDNPYKGNLFKIVIENLPKTNYKPKIFLKGWILTADTILNKYEGSAFDYCNEISFVSSKNKIEFFYEAILQNYNARVKYQYRLINYLDNWSNSTNDDKVSFTSLPPGSYTFQVRVSNSDGIWSPYVLSIPVNVLPPWYRTWWAYASYVLLGFGSVYGFVRRRTQVLEKEKQRLETIVEERTQEVVEQKNLIEEKQREIIDSINYAKRIQYTLLAHEDFLKENIPNHFVYFNPKDIVSGDYYWASKRGNKFYLAVCDSTGHGVPGAFMSLLNIGFLTEAINEKGLEAPNEVLEFVRQRLIDNISKEGQKDGFDGILLCIEQNVTLSVVEGLSAKITYAAANNAPILISNGEMMDLECDRMPVGKGERTNKFQLFTIDYKHGDTLYLYTDGYADQFGGPRGKKFMYKKLNQYLQEISSQPLAEQKEKLKGEFDSWKGDLEQVDDVCIIGVRL